MRYRAAVLHETGGRFSIGDVELQPLEPGDVLVRLHASGLCQTDLEVIEGALPYPLPIVLGHEGAGVVERVGAAVRMARVEAGSAVVVVGCGAVGLHAIQGARLQQADTIVAVDLDPGRLALARAMGATHLLGPADGDAAAQAGVVRGLTAGRGADFVFECAGGEAALQLALDCTRPGGSLTILGKVAVDRKVSLRLGSLMGERRILRSSYGGARPRRDFPWLARLCLDGRLKLDDLMVTGCRHHRRTPPCSPAKRSRGSRSATWSPRRPRCATRWA